MTSEMSLFNHKSSLFRYEVKWIQWFPSQLSLTCCIESNNSNPHSLKDYIFVNSPEWKRTISGELNIKYEHKLMCVALHIWWINWMTGKRGQNWLLWPKTLNTFGKLDLKMRQMLGVMEGAKLGQHCPSSRRLGVQTWCPRNSLCREGLLVTLWILEEGRWWKTLPLPLHSLV